MCFCLITRQENGSLKNITGQEFGSQEGITGQKLGFQISLLSGNWDLIFNYRMGEPNSCPVMIFESQILFRN